MGHRTPVPVTLVPVTLKVSSEATEGSFGKSVAYFPIRYRNSGAKSAPLAHSIVVGVNPY